MEGIPALTLWETIVEVFTGKVDLRKQPFSKGAQSNLLQTDLRTLTDVDFVPPTIPSSRGLAKLILLEDNDAVIKMCTKGRSPALRHVTRTHRVDLDWLFERIRTDPGMRIKFVGTKKQIADIFTKGAFTESQWRTLCRLAQVGPSQADTGKGITKFYDK